MTSALLRLAIVFGAFVVIYIYSCAMVAAHFAGVDGPRRSRMLFLRRLFSSCTCLHFADCPEPGPHNVDVHHDAEVVAKILGEADRLRAQKIAKNVAKKRVGQLRDSLRVVKADPRLQSLNSGFIDKAEAELGVLEQDEAPAGAPRSLPRKSQSGRGKIE